MITPNEALDQPKTLSPEISNLVLAINSGEVYETGQRGVIVRYNFDAIHPPLTKADLKRAVQDHAYNPIRTHKLIKYNIRSLKDQERARAHIEAATDLEILLDRLAFQENTTPTKGIPEYIMDGYTDMGQLEDNDDRRFNDWGEYREKFRIEKDKIRNRIELIRKKAIERGGDELLEYIADFILKIMPYDSTKVQAAAKAAGSKTIIMNDDVNFGVCSHYAVMAQIFLQAAGIRSKVEKGIFFGNRHAWNLIEDPPERIFDVTEKLRNEGKSALVPVSARIPDFLYCPKPPEMNFYKIVHS